MNIAYLPRQALVTVNSGFAVNSGTDFGAKPVSGYSRITGLASVVGSLTIRMRTGVAPGGPFFVSSNWVANSGNNILDVPNYGGWTNFDITAALSQTPILQIFGDPVR